MTKKTKLWALSGVGGAVTLIALACGGYGPPSDWTNSSPPPGFALSYLLQSTIQSIPTIPYMDGTVLEGSYRADILSQQFQPYGSYSAWAVETQNGWVVNDYARWPAIWNIGPDSGPCAGQRVNGLIVQKIEASVCQYGFHTLAFSPGSYEGDLPPIADVSADPSVVPPYSSATAYVVDQDGNIIQESDISVDGDSSGQFQSPWVYDGSYYTVMPSADQTTAAVGTFYTYGNPSGGDGGGSCDPKSGDPNCPPPTW